MAPPRAWGRGAALLLPTRSWRQEPQQAPQQQHRPKPACRKGQSHLYGERGRLAPSPSRSPAAASKPAWEDLSSLQGCPSHPGVGGAPCFGCFLPALLTHQGSICNRVRPHSSTAAGEAGIFQPSPAGFGSC